MYKSYRARIFISASINKCLFSEGAVYRAANNDKLGSATTGASSSVANCINYYIIQDGANSIGLRLFAYFAKSQRGGLQNPSIDHL